MEPAATDRLFYLLNGYRIFLALALLMGGGIAPDNFSLAAYRDLFFLAVFGYLLLAVLFFLLAYAAFFRHPAVAYVESFVDLIFVGLFMHIAGGVGSGIGILLIIPVLAVGQFAGPRHSLLLASLVSLALLLGNLYQQLTSGINDYPPALLLCLSLFVCALLANRQLRRNQEREQLLEQQELDLENMEHLNSHIINHIEAGVLVVDADYHIVFANQSAKRLLALPDDGTAALEQAAPRLFFALRSWRQDEQTDPDPVTGLHDHIDLQPQFFSFSKRSALIYLFDVSAMTQELQQRKLVSLGRLSASIAHEVRNPLSAISHAAQLLDESPQLQNADKNLLAIILRHCRAMDRMVEDILQISKRGRVELRPLEVADLLRQFQHEFGDSQSVPLADLRLSLPRSRPLMMRFVSEQLKRVLWNLCLNARQHGKNTAGQTLRLHIRGGWNGNGYPYLNVLDNGGGIPSERVAQIFEPFVGFGDGTGLGLYLARELCSFNESYLHYYRLSAGSCFQILCRPPRLLGKRQLA